MEEPQIVALYQTWHQVMKKQTPYLFCTASTSRLSGTEDNKEQESDDENLIPPDSEDISGESSEEKDEEQDGE
ncbi:hypothetical protein ElyMa_006738000 [Elysia marginata]|uniref:Uncharacterized protein n=1 Tax=Elysia marginata TaxID=1093978 RepID=A0AAV4IUF3_9GAST|nr:hypothetical protein ElyMa_006738000 [Elysia marginata]